MTVEDIIYELQKLPKDLKVYTCRDVYKPDVVSLGIKIRKIIVTMYDEPNKEKLAVFFEPLVSYGNVFREEVNMNDPYHSAPFPREVDGKWM